MLAMYFPITGELPLPAIWDSLSGGLGGMSMWSSDALTMALIISTASPGLVLLDQTAWKAFVHSSPSAAPRGTYIAAWVCFFVPFALGTACGLAARAWKIDLTPGDVMGGLVAPAVIQEFGGRGIAWLYMFATVAAMNSSAAHQFEALGQILAFDAYSRFVHVSATRRDVGKVRVVAPLVLVPLVGGVTLSLVYSATPPVIVLVASGLVTNSFIWLIVCSHIWKTIPPVGALAGGVGGLALAIIVWLSLGGWTEEVGVGLHDPQKWGGHAVWAGNLTGLFASPIISLLVTVLYDRQGPLPS